MLHRTTARRCLAAAALATALIPASAQARTTTAEGEAILIDDVGAVPPASPYPSSVQVNGAGPVSDVKVRIVGFMHDYPDDVDLALRGPQGQTVMLMSDASPGNWVLGGDVTFSDDAFGPVPDGVYSGTYLPTNRDDGSTDLFPSGGPSGEFASSLSVFDESDPNGTWSLFAVDDTPGDVGSIARWTLEVTDRPWRTVAIAPGQQGNEGAGKLTVVVTRPASGFAGAMGYSTPNVGSRGGTATPGGDFTPVSGTLNFAPGESAKSFDIPLVNDGVAERAETIPLSLRNISGDALVPTTMLVTAPVVTIQDDDAAQAVKAPSVTAGSSRLTGKAVVVSVTTGVDSSLAASGSIAVPGAAKSVKLKGSSGSAKAGKATTLRLKVPSKSLKAIAKALKRKKKLTATVRVTATDALGRKSSGALKLRLKR